MTFTNIIGALFLIFLWVLPFISIVGSSKVSGNEKMAWLLLVFFVSWFAWIFFLLVAPISRQETDEV